MFSQSSFTAGDSSHLRWKAEQVPEMDRGEACLDYLPMKVISRFSTQAILGKPSHFYFYLDGKHLTAPGRHFIKIIKKEEK